MGHDLVKAVHDLLIIPRSLHKPHMLLARAKKSTDEYTQKQTMPLKSPIRLLCLVAMVSFCLLARRANAGVTFARVTLISPSAHVSNSTTLLRRK